MNCQDLHERFELYSLGLLDTTEKEELEAHLETGCVTCRRRLQEALSLKALMLSQAPELVPPSRMRRRLLAAVGVQAPIGVWISGVLAAAVLLTGLWLIREDISFKQEIKAEKENAPQEFAEATELRDTVDFLRDARTRSAPFGIGQAGAPQGNVYINPDLGVLLLASGVPPPPSGFLYQLWLIHDGKAESAGSFRPEENGGVVFLRPSTGAGEPVTSIEATVEPATGSPSPTTRPILQASFEPPPQ